MNTPVSVPLLRRMSAARLLLLAALLTLACALLAPLFLAHADNVPPEPNTHNEADAPYTGDCHDHENPSRSK